MKVCCVFNYNPLYRFPIYDAMSKEFDCDFYFGDTVFEPLKKFDANELKGFKKYIKAKKTNFKGYIWHSGIAPIFSRKYTHYILTGNTSMIVNWLILLYAFIFRKKVYMWTHGIKTFKLKWTASFILKSFYRSTTGILMYNQYNCQFMEALGVKKERLHVIHNSLDTKLQTEKYQKLSPSNIYKQHFGNNNSTIIYIGRIQKRMKVEMLIEALSIMKEKGVYINAVIVGSYMDGVDIEKMVQEKGLTDQVWMYGPSFNEDVNSELIYNADVCVAPGTVGLTAIHALSYGTPCITHSNHTATGPEFEAINEGITGSFFEENNVKSLVNAISKWINLSSAQRDNIRKVARQEVENNWSVDSQIKLLNYLLK